MTSDSSDEQNAPNAPKPDEQTVSAERAAYNVVSDTVTGVNVRKSDNVLQAIVVLITMVLLAVVGVILTALNRDWELPWFAGALIGAFAGLVTGIFASGIFLMFYRGVRHIRGKHD